MKLKNRKGSGYFFIWSIIGILLGIFLAVKGFRGEGLTSGFTLFVGIFVAIKEVVDIIHG